MNYDKYYPTEEYPAQKILTDLIEEYVAELDEIPLTKTERTIKEEEQKEKAKAIYKQMVDAYNTKAQELTQQFWEDMRVEHDYAHLSPKQISAIEGKAWDDGHWAGFSEVSAKLSDLVPFVKTILEV